MALRKKIFFFSLFLLLALLALGVSYGLQYGYIGSSYASKMVCSCIFVSGRALDDIKSEDLYAVPFVTVKVNEQEKSVSSHIYGLAKTKAIYRPGLGCTLVNGISEPVLRQQPGLSIDPSAAHLPDLLVAPMPAHIDSLRLAAAVNRAFAEDNPDQVKRTRAILVLYNGSIIVEKYAGKISKDTPLMGWSMAKSVTGTMIGILVHEKKLDIYRPAPIEEWKNDERRSITVDQLLRMSSGLQFEENYAKPSDATHMLFRAKGAGQYALQSRPAHRPDEVFSYSSGTTNILQEIIRRQFDQIADYHAFPYKKLFGKMGMTSAVLEPDASGTFVGSSFLYATARDWAKFGQLYLQDGVWNGERILPEGWVQYVATETPESDGKYGAHFWIGKHDKELPPGIFFADGFEGQFVTIVPSANMVIVRLGCTSGTSFDNIGFVKEVLAGVSGTK